jgi:hypothetical protein
MYVDKLIPLQTFPMKYKYVNQIFALTYLTKGVLALVNIEQFFSQ